MRTKPRAHTACAHSRVILVTPLLLEIQDKTLGCLVKIQHVDVLGVSFPEEEGLEQLPDLSVAPVLAQDVGRVFIAIDMVEPDDGACYGLASAVKQQSIMAVVELGMWNCRAIHNRRVVSKHVHFRANRDTQISQGVPEINLLIHTNTSSDKLRSIGGSLDCCLLLGVPVNGVLLVRWRMPVADHPVIMSWYKFASM